MKELEKELDEYWKIVSEGKEFESDLEREWFYVSIMHDFAFGGVRQNIKRTKMIDKMLNEQNDL